MISRFDIEKFIFPCEIKEEFELIVNDENDDNTIIVNLKDIKNKEISKMIYYYFLFCSQKRKLVKYYYDGFVQAKDYLNMMLGEQNSSIMDYTYQEFTDNYYNLFKDKKRKVYLYFVGSFYVFCESYYKMNSGKNEFDCDVWDITKLGIDINMSEIKKIIRMDFRRVKSQHYKRILKEYILYELRVKSSTTVAIRKGKLIQFFNYIYIKEGDVAISNISRDIVFGFFENLQTNSMNTKKFSKYHTSVKMFFDYCVTNNLISKSPLTKYDKVRLVRKKDPRPLSKDDLECVIEGMNYLSEKDRDMLFVDIRTGLRPIDLSILKIDDLEEDEGNYYLNYYSPKVNSYSRMSISKIVGDVLKKNIEKTKRKYGEKAKYIFQYNSNPINFTNVITRLNKVFIQKKIKKSGKIMHVTAYNFRYSIASILANADIDGSIIAKQLGHKNLKNLSFYAKINNSTIKNASIILHNIVDKLIDLSDSNKKVVKVEGEREVELQIINGICKAGINHNCKNGNSCISCSLFRAYDFKQALKNIDHEIKLVEIDLEMAKENEFSIVKDYCKDLLDKLYIKKGQIEREIENVKQI